MKKKKSRGISEAETRRRLIDQRITHAGWGPIASYEAGQTYRDETVIEFQTEKGPVDYALFYDGRPMALIEAKRLSVGPQNVLKQAQRYARGFPAGWWEFDEYKVPFIYSTNGKVIWFQDLRQENSRSRELKHFHTPQALLEILSRGRTDACKWLSENTSLGTERLRDYQREAVQGVEEALCKGKRRMMVAMATGTGKTFTAISLLYRMIKSGYAKRILFLVDRRALAAQAATSMSVFEPEPGLKFDKIYEVYTQKFRREDIGDGDFDIKELPTKYLTEPNPDHTFVYVCTIQRMRINLFGLPSWMPEGDVEVEEDAGTLDIPIHAFDLIIADECHRGYTTAETSKWREVLEHFDAIQIGLTATPAMHSMAYFNDIVYRYKYEQAVRDGWLVDYDAVRITSNIRMKGMFLKPGEGVEFVDTSTGESTFDQLEDQREFDIGQLEMDATSPDSNRKIVKEFAAHALEQEKRLGRFPKTLVFAINDIAHQSHCDDLVDFLRDEFGRGDDFVAKITGSPSVDRPLQLIREFRNRPNPRIVVSVDMLSTGVDIPSLENILFIRPVKSRILFEQMMGRGTRTCKDLAPAKDHFTVYDAVGVIDYMNASAFTENPPSKPSRTFSQIVEDVKNNVDRNYNINLLVKRLLRVERNVTFEGRDAFKIFIPDGAIGKFGRELPERLTDDFAETIRILTDKEFQRLIREYEKSPKIFWVAHDQEDIVGSEILFKTTDGKALKPDEYLAAFEKHVDENPTQIDSLRILLKRPKEFATRHLSELRKKLEELPERFTAARLSKARKLRQRYDKELADIISLVLEVAYDEESTPDERAYEAIRKIREQLELTPEQERWLNMIREALPAKLLISREDFRPPPFSRSGGWSKADKEFGGNLEQVLQIINEVMVS
jgi:type I restriction enzyme R subunit